MAEGHVIYEVNLAVDRGIEAEYLAWLREHVAEMLSLDGFDQGRTYRRHPSDDDGSSGTGEGSSGDGRVLFTVHYRVRSLDHLEAYFRDHAARMREDGQRRFGGRFQATRRILEAI